MTGNDRVRFCSHCAKDVNNLSSMTRRDAIRLVRRSSGRVCIRYMVDPRTNAPMFAEQLIQISRRAPRVVAGVMSASLSLSTFAYAQGRIILANPPHETKEAGDTDIPIEFKGVIVGTVTDSMKAVVPGAAVWLSDESGNKGNVVNTDDNGEYRLERVPTGKYTLSAVAPGFRTYSSDVVISDDRERVKNVTLEVGAVGGVVVTSGPEYEGPIMIAVQNDDLDEVRRLIAAGEDVNRAEDDDSTPIFTAVTHGNLEMVRMLIDFGAKVNVRNDEKQTPLMMIDDDASLELVQLLLKNGSKVNAVAKEGDTALIRLAREAKPEILQALLDAGAEIDAQNKEGVTALMNAADVENFENVKLLVLAGADINLRDEEGDNAWDYTAEEEIEAFLVAHGVQLDPGEAEDIDHDVKRWLNGDYEEPAGDDVDGDGQEDEPKG
jgi:ankyrin repeat protein